MTEQQTDLSKYLEGLEIKPNTNQILVMPYKENPYTLKEDEDGLLVSETPQFKDYSNDGEVKEMQQAIMVGKVVEVGPEVRYVEPGDDVYFYIGSSVPIPFFNTGLVALSESRALVFLNKNLEARLSNNTITE